MKKILIIEDDPIVAHVYRSRLEKEGFQVEVAPDGQMGYQLLCQSKPDGMLLDLMLPKLNGIDLLKKIRGVREFEKLPIVVFTNAYVANMIHEAFSSGASAVYNKSTVTPRQIIDVLSNMLSPNGEAAVAAAATGTAALESKPAPVLSPAPSASSVAAKVRPTEKPAMINSSDDADFQKELQTSFLKGSAAAVTEIRKLLQETSKADEAARANCVEQLYRKVRSFTSGAGMAGIYYLAKFGAAVEALLKEMLDKPKTVTPSTLRTVAQAVDFFGELCKPGHSPDLAENPPIDILIVDDEVLSRRAIVYALEKAFLKAVAVEDAEAALARTKNTKFDLVFLDVNMPGMHGFQLCDKLRETGANRTTPIIFVTGTTDFQVRAQSTLRGASDLIAKPFMFIELTVKALTFALRHRIEARKQAARLASRTSARCA
jgi:CheY-like chemotaxis protein